MSHTDITQPTRQVPRGAGGRSSAASVGRWRGDGGRGAVELALLGAILVLGPFFRGLFFDQQVLYFTFIIGLLLASTARLGQKTDLMELALFGLA